MSQHAYDAIGAGYGNVRREDPRIQHAINEGLGGAARVVNVGSGAGSYEPIDRCIASIEPSIVMIKQRVSSLGPAVQATAESLPLADGASDAALAVHTVQHWDDLARGLAEMQRVARRVVILTMDPEVIRELWIIKDYTPEIAATHVASLPSMRSLLAALPGAEVRTIDVPRDCTDGFLAAFWGRPEAYLEPEVRRATSPWHQIPSAATDRAIAQLSHDLADGTWDERYGCLRLTRTCDVGLRLVVAP